jgi:regulator of protease activity HflC (stomatin/prohibitin superfamily)
VAEGNKQAKILESEAEKQQLINAAQGSAQAVVAAGEARAKSIHAVALVSGPRVLEFFYSRIQMKFCTVWVENK